MFAILNAQKAWGNTCLFNLIAFKYQIVAQERWTNRLEVKMNGHPEGKIVMLKTDKIRSGQSHQTNKKLVNLIEFYFYHFRPLTPLWM